MVTFGKIIDGILTFHNPYQSLTLEDGSTLFTNEKNILESLGYKEIIYTSPSPEEGYIASGYDWVEAEDSIIQSWNYEIAPEEPPSEEERISALEEALLELITLLLPAEEVNE